MWFVSLLESEQTSDPARQLWSAALGHLELEIPRPNYETWLKDTSALSLSDGQLIVGTPSAFVAEMLQRRLSTTIGRVLEQIAGRQVDVRFRVSSPPSQDSTSSPNTEHDPVESTTAGAPNAGMPMNPAFTFESFIVGPSNALAHAAATKVAEEPGRVYNPLYIYSRVGLGKTHLLHAAGYRLAAAGLRVLYVSSERFTNEYIRAIREGDAETFRERYRSADVLLVDDIQFIAGKEQTQEGFFHTFNELHMTGRQVIITGDEPARQSLLEERIKSRLQGGLVADIQPPDFETRSAILRSKLDGMNVRIPTQVLDSLAQRSLSNVRELEGYLHRIVAYAQLTGRPITPEMANDAVRSLLAERPKRSAPTAAVVNAVAEHTGIDEDALRGQRRDQRTASARRLAMYLLREESHLPSTRSGQLLGGKDHSTVLYAQKKLEEDLERDPQLRQALVSIRQSIAAATLT